MEHLQLQINGQNRSFPELPSPTTLDSLVEALNLKADRIAAELNGEIAPRGSWSALTVVTGDRLEIVHFVGGG